MTFTTYEWNWLVVLALYGVCGYQLYTIKTNISIWIEKKTKTRKNQPYLNILIMSSYSDYHFITVLLVLPRVCTYGAFFVCVFSCYLCAGLRHFNFNSTIVRFSSSSIKCRLLKPFGFIIFIAIVFLAISTYPHFNVDSL